MLARPIDGDPDSAIRDLQWALEVKLNGKRLLADGTSGKLLLFNRHGERTDAPRSVRKELETLVTIGAIFDGELVDDRYWVFDMPTCASIVLPPDTCVVHQSPDNDGVTVIGPPPWVERRAALEALFDPHIWKPNYVKLLPVARTTARKRTMAKKIWHGGYEGFILKQISSPYRPGGRAGEWLKVKNVRTVDCIVESFGTDKHNVQLTVYLDGERVPIGECSRYEGDAPRAKVGDVIEVEYLDAGSPESPRLCQPHAKRLRDDKTPAECTLDQLDGSYANKKVLV